ncbi:MAG: CRTAC1 family protein, partial [Planctomycetota bacterium]
DQLYRHLPVDQPRWTAATEAARISEGMFGQGIAVADANNDGLDDVYVCNIGRNRLWLNCGDGTFLPADPLLPSEDVWTSSALMVDLDLDGNVEIYDANYVSGEDVFTRLCPVGNKARSCSPLVFQPTPDRLWTGDGGQYRRIDMPSMVGNGLGCVAFALQGNRVPSVFVSVDQQANLFGVVVQTADGWTLEDEAIVRGLAYDADGNAQACMGIATADVNDDGALDLYVTNFYLEYNTLYQQTSFGFEDVTAVSGTAAATKPMLGFGTQFIDVQLDGIADLVVLNGHVDDHTHMNVPEAMPPQLFLGRGGGRFDLVDGPQAGDFFASRRLGRALAKLDADGDGDEDLIAQDLENPVAIVENQTPANRIPVRIELVGVDCDRNAFTAIATLESGDYRQTQQLVAGGGYQAANERQLTFAVPRDSGPLTLTIHWPGGGSESYAALHSGSKYIAIQGQGVHAVGTLR